VNFLKCTELRTTPFDQYFLGFDLFEVLKCVGVDQQYTDAQALKIAYFCGTTNINSKYPNDSLLYISKNKIVKIHRNYLSKMILFKFIKFIKCTELRTTPFDQYSMGVKVCTTPIEQYFLGIDLFYGPVPN
jgi:hypothetical protein